ncbi:thioredoxin domain-containing protein, partial [Candidatus Saccharibacteria bacterium]|nr:thioredoxin domain-containing protein [Candidatus Saccharibacteria bacterium]
ANVQPTNHITGENTTGVTLVEYGDFECPACGSFYPLIEQVKEKYKDKIAFQFRHLPLVQIHKNALAAARAAEAAANQGKFWEMYHLLFQNQRAWAQSSDAKPTFIEYAAQLQLDMQKFREDMDSSETNARVNADIAEFKKTKETMSTPTFFLDGKKITAGTLEEFSKLIDEAIAAKQGASQGQEQSTEEE